MSHSNPFCLHNRTAIVTGGLGKVGFNCARALTNAGARVILVDTNKDRWNELSEDQKKQLTLDVRDVSDSSLIPSHVGALYDAYGFDIWVNSAYPRTTDWGVPPERDTPESWRQNVDMQMNTYCLASDHAAQHMAKSASSGSIINISSIYGMVGPDFNIYENTDVSMPAAYAAIKGGIISHSRFLASYYAPQGVRVNVVCPGGIEGGQNAQFIAAYNKRTPMGRLATDDEIGPPVVFLASDAASYITGVVLPIDGGWTAI